MIWNALLLALREIRRNIMRSTLTILGVVIGVAAVITLVTLGEGATAQVTTEIESLGSNLLMVHPGQRRRGPGGVRSASKLFEVEDAEAIARELPGVKAAAPLMSAGVVAINGNINWETSATGVDGNYFKIVEVEVDQGRLFNSAEIRSGASVCVLGGTVTKELFAESNPVGAMIRLQNKSCKVIGSLKSMGQASFGGDRDDVVLMPLVSFQRRIAGRDDIGNIYVSARDGISTKKLMEDIISLLRQRRRIPDDEDEDFHIHDMKEIASTLSTTTAVLTGLLGAVAAVSLIVGGIGIMNIMLVSVTERTREIGIRLAIGAMERDVMRQFLIEAIALSGLGGVIGIALGLVGSVLIGDMLGFPFVFNSSIVLLSFSVSCLIGVIFGYFPARKASRLNPIDALRYE